MVGIRLQTNGKFKDEFRTSSIETKIIYIWITQLFSIVFALLLHLFLKKCSQKITVIHLLYENSSSKIMLLCFVVDLKLIKSLLHKCITKIIQSLKDDMQSCCLDPNIPLLTNTSKRSISNITNIIIKFLLKFCILGSYFCKILILVFIVLPFLLLLMLSMICIVIGLIIGIAFLIYVFANLFIQEIMRADSTFKAVCLGFAGIWFIIIFFGFFGLLLFAFMPLPFPKLKLKLKAVTKLLYTLSKNLFLFLIAFVPYYVFISAALYLLVFILPFAAIKVLYVLAALCSFCITIIRLFFLCRKSKKIKTVQKIESNFGNDSGVHNLHVNV